MSSETRFRPATADEVAETLCFALRARAQAGPSCRRSDGLDHR